MHGLDDRKDTMRDMLKQMIDKQVGIIIAQWKGRTDQAMKTG
jgi:F420-0:gamma-glutamyl ligase